MIFEELTAVDFIDKSFTLSYSFDAGGWVSLHDYIPNLMLGTRSKRLLSTVGGKLYLHNAGEYGIFYDTVYPSYITPVLALPIKEGVSDNYPFFLKSISWDAHSYKGTMRMSDIFSTFISIEAHNSIVGMTDDLIAYDENCSILNQWEQANCRLVKNRWRFNKFFDSKIDPYLPTFEESYSGFNSSNILKAIDAPCEDYKKKFMDTFVVFKLVFNNEFRFIINEIGYEIQIVKR